MEKRSIVVQVKQEMAVTTELEQLLPVVEEKLPLSSASKPKKPSTEATSAAPSPKAKEKQEQKKVKVELAETVLDEKVGLSNENNNNKQQQKWQLQRIVSAAENQCRCLIDLSSPASLERDFYAWLNGAEPVSDISRPCLFSNIQSYSPPSPPITLLNMPTSQRLSMLSLQHHTTTECHYSHGFVPGGCKVPAFLVAPPPPPLPASVSDCASSACSLSSSSISPGTNCSSTFGSSRDNNNNNNSGGSSSASSAAASSSFSCSYQLQPSSFPPHFHQNLQQQQQQKIKSVSADQFFGGIAGGNAAEKTTMICGGAARMRRKRNVDKASGRGTNLYGRSYCPGRPLSMEERAQIVQLFHGGMKVNAISKQLCISHGCVSKIITRFRETGNLMPSSHSECRRRKRQQQQQLQQQQLNAISRGQGIG